MQMSSSLEGVIRLRMSSADAHDGDEGLSRVMTSEFLAPVRSGDYLEIRAKIVAVGKSSRTIECTAHKLIELVHPDDSAANVLAQPVLVAKATDVAVVPLDKQRVAR
jgi:3-aminobutyryl-CoA ammonia-lyase